MSKKTSLAKEGGSFGSDEARGYASHKLTPNLNHGGGESPSNAGTKSILEKLRENVIKGCMECPIISDCDDSCYSHISAYMEALDDVEREVRKTYWNINKFLCQLEDDTVDAKTVGECCEAIERAETKIFYELRRLIGEEKPCHP